MFQRGCWTFAWVIALAVTAVAELPAEDLKPDQAGRFHGQTMLPFVEKYCSACHFEEDPEGVIRLDVFPDVESIRRQRETWQKVERMLRSRDMPPRGMPKPEAAEVDEIVAWIKSTLDQVDCTGQIDPGRVTIRRLNRVEYTNTIRDLLGVEFDAADDFPADDVGYGFDNIGDVLSLPPLLMEKYFHAAEQIATRATVSRPDKNMSDDAAARQILQRLAGRAYRRPATDREIDRLTQLVALAQKHGDGFETSIRLAMQAVLVSPNFLFRVELDPVPNTAETIRELNEYELATRLSYFLWSSMPDEELFNEAAGGTLRRNLDDQVRRMLADPKSRALVENFAGQWLELRNLDAVAPDPKLFGPFDDELRESMRTEALKFFEHIMREDRSVLELVDADYTFVDQRLAEHYGLSGVKGDQFRQVSLAGQPRGGVITMAGVLTVTSNPTRTSPVKRGKWILENILGTPPPPPPPNVPLLDESQQAILSGSLRERMQQHRENPNCAVCHLKMDAMGFALENYDAVGNWRTKDGKFAIDPSGELPDGRSFKGPGELKAILRDTGKADFARCLTEKMLTYALGRGLETYDRCAVDAAAKALADEDYRFSTLVLQIVHSDPFQKRQGKE